MKYVLLFPLVLFSCMLQAQQADSSLIQKLKTTPPFLYQQSNALGLKLAFNGVFIHDELLYFSFSISNRSRLNYPVDFIHVFIRDQVTAKRTSVQELELVPLYMDSLSNVPAKRKQNFVFVLPQFNLPDHKECILELFERNGGRNLRCRITNRFIYKARPLLCLPVKIQ